MAANDQHRALLDAGLRQLGVAMPPDKVARLLAYLDELSLWNRAYNLTAVRDYAAMISRHLLDSLALKPWLEAGHYVDVGSGAGLPGVPLAIADRQLRFDLLDANGKKARFLRHVVRELDLGGVGVIESRLEEFQPRRAYDGATARAFAPLDKLAAGVRHLLAPGSKLLAMQAVGSDDAGIEPAGYRVLRREVLEIPGSLRRQLTILEVL